MKVHKRFQTNSIKLGARTRDYSQKTVFASKKTALLTYALIGKANYLTLKKSIFMQIVDGGLTV